MGTGEGEKVLVIRRCGHGERVPIPKGMAEDTLRWWTRGCSESVCLKCRLSNVRSWGYGVKVGDKC